VLLFPLVLNLLGRLQASCKQWGKTCIGNHSPHKPESIAIAVASDPIQACILRHGHNASEPTVKLGEGFLRRAGSGC